MYVIYQLQIKKKIIVIILLYSCIQCIITMRIIQSSNEQPKYISAASMYDILPKVIK